MPERWNGWVFLHHFSAMYRDFYRNIVAMAFACLLRGGNIPSFQSPPKVRYDLQFEVRHRTDFKSTLENSEIGSGRMDRRRPSSRTAPYAPGTPRILNFLENWSFTPHFPHSCGCRPCQGTPQSQCQYGFQRSPNLIKLLCYGNI